MELILQKLKAAVQQLFGEQLAAAQFDPEKIAVTPAPENQAADFASNVAMQINKIVGLPPREVATQIKDALDAESAAITEPVATTAKQDAPTTKSAANSPAFTTDIAGPGFLNFTLSDASLIQALHAPVDQQSGRGKTIVCEFSDPNPFKVLHVGHLYTSVVGDAIARLQENTGARVIRANFGGDVGLHVAKNLYIMLQHQAEMEKLAVPGVSADERAAFMARCYVEGTAAYEDDPAAKEKITQLNGEIYSLVSRAYAEHKIDPSDPTHHLTQSEPDSMLARTYWLGREWSYAYFAEFYAQIGLKFDKYYPESSVAETGRDTVLKGLKAGVFTKSDGAVIFPGEKYGLHTRVFINQNGIPTYEAKDVGLSITKWRDYHFDQSLIITGNDILDYMKVVIKAISLVEHEPAARTRHLTHGNVKLAGNVKMSSRKGNFLKAIDVLALVRQTLADQYGQTSEEVVLAAIKYAFLKNKIGADLVFDPAESVNMTGNSGPYLQYATVRARKILAKCKTAQLPADYQLGPHERQLVLLLGQWPSTLQTATAELAPHKICAYLYELAQEFSRFYENVTVAGSDQEAARAALVAQTADTLTRGLELLGINVPEQM